MIKIKNKSGIVIYNSEKETIKGAVEEAIKNKANLCEANLWRADLRRADLSEANLIGADLNCIFYKTKTTQKQKEQIFNSDLFDVVSD